MGSGGSVKEQVAGCVELYIGDDACDEFQEDEEGKVRLNFMSCLYHSIGHALEDSCVPARVNGWHGEVIDERELLNGQGFVEILSLYVLSDGLVADRGAIFASG
jgi:hypothetical protein